jgi:uncharacterized membrane protein
MRTKLLAVAGALIVLGVLAFMLQPGAPEGECAPEGATQTSGFQDAESGCPLTIESADEIMDYNSAPKPFRIAGLVLVLAGIATAVVALVRGRNKPGAGPEVPGSPAP